VSTLEDTLREVARSAAAEITPDSIRPLDLSRVPRSARLRLRRGGRAGTLIPLAATAVVTAMVAAALAAAAGLGAQPPTSSAGPPGWSHAVPRYYVALTSAVRTRPGRASQPPASWRVLDATVRATTTGHMLAKVAAPRPFVTFRGVTAAADDRTFVLAATRTVVTPRTLVSAPPGLMTAGRPAAVGFAKLAGPRAAVAGAVTARLTVGFFLLRYHAAAPGARLTWLPIQTVTPAARLQGMALSPDGSRLAVALGGREIRIYSVRSGAAQAWTTAGPAAAGARLAGLSWTADGRFVGFDAVHWGGRAGLNVLNTGGPDTGGRPGRLLAASRLVLRAGVPVPGTRGLRCLDGAVLAPDGSTVACAAIRRSRASPRGQLAGFAEFSARTGTLLRYLAVGGTELAESPGAVPRLLWISHAGRRLIARARGPAGLIGSGQAVALPGSGPPAGSSATAGSLPVAAW
jgi:hypothetical protein